ncbi:helix-turn-helix domain-containing protein [Solimicrobium silvestre]|uniref:Helix-turn-helix domain n=1 Tax=Solimicrobium silvestre TaxID=2099400 RepID=A0A2S9GW78_9BURK|nr:RodZ domain-containing protein [Solimicrobium silvestre]PRC91916.1 Helix-turn-helix domain [Solimicrobium silvestre]
MSEGVKLAIVSESGASQSTHASNAMSVGERLAFARTQQGLSIEQIAGQLKWSTRQIVEIEAGNYAVLPDLSTVRGFVRTYAKILKLDAAPLLEELSLEFAKLPVKAVDRPLLDTPFPTGRMPWLGRQNNRSQRVFGGLFLAFLVLLAVFVYRAELFHLFRSILPVSVESKAEHADVLTVQPDTHIAMPATLEANSPSVGISPSGVSRPVAEASVAPVSASVPTQVPASVSANESLPVTPVQKTETKNINPDDSLVLSFKQDSWVQIKHSDGSAVSSHLYKAGTEEVVNVSQPLNLIIGNGPGVEAKLRGQNLVLQKQNGSNVVNLSVK